MSVSTTRLQAVPTNIITGFLGVGKTTSILHLLKSKPENQRWAVLVNEFGEIGVDGSIMQGRHSESQDIYVREVAGGCMCCAAGLPMQVALNQLLSIARPDRLLIEPTGLGHPKEVLQVLSGSNYRHLLSIQKIVTLVNARQLHDQRYTDNEIFNQQIEVADIIAGNKSDLYQHRDKETLQRYTRSISASQPEVVFTVNGEIDHHLLTGESGYVRSTSQVTTHATAHHHSSDDSKPVTMNDHGYIRKANEGDGFHSVGWRFSEDKTFRRDELFSFLNSIEAERVKAVMNTEHGVFGYNMADGAVSEIQLFGRGQSCIEIITGSVNDDWDFQLLQCLAVTDDQAECTDSKE